ncbi:MAG: hypothetical protein HY726_10720 [Candidatus Rokubacteria bacterium]|nr:hypothetical protein [Candidatus Rokubacteria bacterium]
MGRGLQHLFAGLTGGPATSFGVVVPRERVLGARASPGHSDSGARLGPDAGLAPALDKGRLLREGMFLSGSRLVWAGFGLLRGGVVAALLGPAFYGVVNLVNLVVNYASFSHFGIKTAARREILYFQGKGLHGRAAGIAHVAYRAHLVISVLVAVGLMVSVLSASGEALIRLAFLVAACLIVLLAARTFLEELTYVQKAFALARRFLLLDAWLRTGLIVGSVLVAGLHGVLAAMVVSEILLFFYLLRRVGLPERGDGGRGELRRLLGVGIALFLGDLSLFGLRTADNLMVVTFLTHADWGYYGLVILVVTILTNFLGDFIRVLYPYYQEQYGRQEAIESMAGYVVTPTRIMSVVSALIVGIGFLTVHIPVQVLLPAYLPAVPALRVLLVSVFFVSVTWMHENILVSQDRRAALILTRMALLAAKVAGAYLLLKAGYRLEGVALASVCCWALYAVLVFAQTTRSVLAGGRTAMRYCLGLLYPFLGMILGVVAGIGLYGVGAQSPGHVAVQLGVLGGVFLPTVVVLERQTGVFRVLRRVVATDR